MCILNEINRLLQGDMDKTTIVEKITVTHWFSLEK